MEGHMFGGNVLHMNEQHKQYSYANNSVLQKAIISKAMVMVEECIKRTLEEHVPTCFKMADFGCSSGPNAFHIISHVIKTTSQHAGSAEVQVFVNDLPGNDFNSIFRSLPDFIQGLKKEKGDMMGRCYIAAVAGSFYGRLFPNQSLHFMHSANSLHWLSKVPEGVENNKRNVHIGKSSPPNVFKSYSEQFRKDFSSFLSARSEEIVPRGRMLLILLCRENPNPWNEGCCFGLLTKPFLDLIAEGVVKEVDVDLFNLPVYLAYKREVFEIIEREGSFGVDKLEFVEVEWDHPIGTNLSNTMRAATEPMLSAHFGEAILDTLFTQYATHVARHLESNKGKLFNVVVSLLRK